MLLDLKSNSLKRLHSEQESQSGDPRQKRNHTEWAVCLTGFSLEDTTARDLKQWVAKVLQDGDMLEQLRGHPVTSCQLNKEENNAYVEFRSEAEHRHFVNLQQARGGYGMITIQNWEDRNLHPIQPALAYPNHDIKEGNDYLAGPSSWSTSVPKELPKDTKMFQPLVIFLHLSMTFRPRFKQIIGRFTEVLQQEKFLGPTEQAFTAYSVVSTYTREGLKLEVRTEELAERVCFCNGKIIELGERGDRKRICLRLSRDRNYQQLPMDWYAYLWKFHRRPDTYGKWFLRASLSCYDNFPLGQTFAEENEQRFESMLNHFGLTADCNQPSLIAGCWAMRDSRMTYDFLVMTSCPKASTILPSLKVCGEVTIEWSLCHQDPTLGIPPLAGESTRVPHVSTQSCSYNREISQPAGYTEAPKKQIPQNPDISSNVAVYLSMFTCPYRSRVIDGINRVMRQEKFVKPHERAIISHLPIAKGGVVVLEAMSEYVAERMCGFNGMLITFCDDERPINSSGFCLRLSRRKSFPQASMDWYSYHLKTYRRPVPGCESIVRLSLTDPHPSDPKPRMFTDLLRSEARKHLGDCSNAREEIIFQCIHMKNSRTGYDYLVMTNSPNTVRDLISMPSCGGIPISWRLCHSEPKMEEYDPSFTTMESQTNAQEHAKNGCNLPVKHDIPQNLSVHLYISKGREYLLVPVIDHLNKIMKEERFVGPDEEALVAYQQPMFPQLVFILEACTERVAEKLCFCTGKLIVLLENTVRSTLFCLRLCRHNLFPQMEMDWYQYISQRRHNVPDQYSTSLLRATLIDPDPFPTAAAFNALLRFRCNSAFSRHTYTILDCWSMRKSRMDYDYLVLTSSTKAAELLSSIASPGGIRIIWSFCREERSAREATSIPIDNSRNIDDSPDGNSTAKNQRPVNSDTNTSAPLQRIKEKPVSPQATMPPELDCDNDVNVLRSCVPASLSNTATASENLSDQDQQELTRMREALSTMTRRYEAQSIELSQSQNTIKEEAEQLADCQSALALARVDLLTRRDDDRANQNETVSEQDLTQTRHALTKVTHKYNTQAVDLSQTMDQISQTEATLQEVLDQRVKSKHTLDALRSDLQERDRQFCSITHALTMMTNQQVNDRKTIEELKDGLAAEQERHRSTKTALKDLILKAGTATRTTTPSPIAPTTGNRQLSSSEARVPSPMPSSSTRVRIVKKDQEEDCDV